MKKILAFFIGIGLICSGLAPEVQAASHIYTADKIAGLNTKYITIDMNNKNIKPVALLAKGNISSVQSVAEMAVNAGAFAAINGTYFDAYGSNKIPIAYNTVIKNGRLVHISGGQPVFGIKSDGRVVMDRLNFNIAGYINGEYRSIPWRVNHPSSEPGAITVYTGDYGVPVEVMSGAKAAVVQGGKVTSIAASSFSVPPAGFAILYNPDVAYLVDERFKVGDEVRWEFDYETLFTKPEDWKDVQVAFGAGPSLIVNGSITANPTAEGFHEQKILKYATPRSFIGVTADGKIKMGNFAKATVAQAAEACKQMGLVNAMCLDGGGSVGLYYNGKSISAGRNVNNALGFIDISGGSGSTPVNSGRTKVVKSNSSIYVDNKEIKMEAYNIKGNNYFKLRDMAYALTDGQKPFAVEYDNASKRIKLVTGKNYEAIGGELAITTGTHKEADKSKIGLWVDDRELNLEGYNIEGYTYFKLRDILKAVDCEVKYNAENKGIYINTEKSYIEQ